MNFEATQIYIDNCSKSDLGVIIDSNLLFYNHIDEALLKANQTLDIIKRIFTFLNKSDIISLYKL